jgi:hypothetical protein
MTGSSVTDAGSEPISLGLIMFGDSEGSYMSLPSYLHFVRGRTLEQHWVTVKP